MLNQIYATFDDCDMAKKAVGALLDHGAKAEDISLIVQEKMADNQDKNVVEQAQSGITTTTKEDAIEGAKVGGAWGLGLGVLAALGFLTIPGFGLVTGGGALATAIASLVGTAVGGGITGGVAGFLRDQGCDEKAALDYEQAVKNGGAMLAIAHPSGSLGAHDINNILRKYNAGNVRTFETAGSKRI